MLSMTGHGEGSAQLERLQVTCEVRAVNNRYLKINVRCPDGYGMLEPKVEEIVRNQLKRGTVNVSLRIDRQLSSEDLQINTGLLHGYLEAVKSIQHATGQKEIRGELLLGLPGVLLDQNYSTVDLDSVWGIVDTATNAALSTLAAMRLREGDAMAKSLEADVNIIETQLEKVIGRAPAVVEGYQTKLVDRITKLLEPYNMSIQPTDIVREVGIYADRCDISEEIVRLKSHIEQFRSVVREKESNGRKLDFLTQEMFRETNTIGSKANDAEISKFVVEMKTAIERIREMVQNVE